MLKSQAAVERIKFPYSVTRDHGDPEQSTLPHGAAVSSSSLSEANKIFLLLK